MTTLQVTTDNLHEVTAQQVFDYVVEKVRQQGVASVVDDKCVYRGANGARCAAGWLLTDNLIKNLISQGKYTWGWSGLCASNLVPSDHKDLIQSLQYAHDEASWSNNFVEAFDNLICQLAEKDFGVSIKFG